MTTFVIDYGRGNTTIATSAFMAEDEPAAVMRAAHDLEAWSGLQERSVAGPQTFSAVRRSLWNGGSKVSLRSSRRWVAAMVLSAAFADR